MYKQYIYCYAVALRHSASSNRNSVQLMFPFSLVYSEIVKGETFLNSMRASQVFFLFILHGRGKIT